MPPQNKKAAVEPGGDRLSALPDAVLQHVLSFLETQEVVRTCVLARRWRHLWRSMPVLRVRGVVSFQALHSFMDHLLLLRERSPLEYCMFFFRAFSEYEMAIVNLWIRYVLLCQVRVLNVAVTGGYHVTDLPVACPMLTKLKIGGLCLHGKFLDFSSCPALEELAMIKCSISADRISSGSLKRMIICACRFESNTRTSISVPSLLWLQLTLISGSTPLLEDMPVLVTAKVGPFDYFCKDSCDRNDPGYCPNGSCKNCYGIDDGSAGCVLLKGLADATYLELIAAPKAFILKRDLRWCPTFTKLKTLLLSQWFESADNHALICILQHSPFLEKLILQLSKNLIYNVHSRAIYNSMEQSFASQNLKTVEVKCQNIDQRVHNLMKSLNSYGIPLEKINIQQTNQSAECFNFVWTGFTQKQK